LHTFSRADSPPQSRRTCLCKESPGSFFFLSTSLPPVHLVFLVPDYDGLLAWNLAPPIFLLASNLLKRLSTSSPLFPVAVTIPID